MLTHMKDHQIPHNQSPVLLLHFPSKFMRVCIFQKYDHTCDDITVLVNLGGKVFYHTQPLNDCQTRLQRLYHLEFQKPNK